MGGAPAKMPVAKGLAMGHTDCSTPPTMPLPDRVAFSLPLSVKSLAKAKAIGDTAAMSAREPPPETTIQSGGAPATSRVLLVVGDGHFDTYALVFGKKLVVGRDPASDVPLPNPKISRRHAYIHVGDTIEIEDLGSTNGTRMGGHRLAEGQRMPLETGKNLQLGPFVAVVLQSAGEATPQEPLRAAIPITDPTPAGVPEVVTRIATGMVSVLITGETGVGKEVLARTIHELSGRTGQFVAINCASL